MYHLVHTQVVKYSEIYKAVYLFIDLFNIHLLISFITLFIHLCIHLSVRLFIHTLDSVTFDKHTMWGEKLAWGYWEWSQLRIELQTL